MSRRTDRGIQFAVRMAYKAPPQGHRVGCAILRKGRLVSVGFNDMRRTHPKSPTKYQKVHAELDAVLGVDAEFLRGATAYVARVRPSGPGLARPCSHCLGILSRVGIRTVAYTLDGGGTAEEKL